MSHCWGKEKFRVLIGENIDEFSRGLPLESFLPSFRDAIVVVRQLGLRYIWIDCSCIVQESESEIHVTEKLQDIAEMGEVYANSILNIGATFADSPKGGCFLHREETEPVTWLSQLYFNGNRDDQEGNKTFHFYQSLDTLHDSQDLHYCTLLKRAWVFQERLLCRRKLYFGGQLYWECQEVPIASETFPCGPKTLEADELVIYPFSREEIESWDLKQWNSAVEEYSRMELSNPTEDKLVAIGGIAQALGEITDGEYFAGIVGKDLLVQLCWTTANPAALPRPQVWRAPSWSWASVECGISFDKFQDSMSLTVTELAHVEEVNLEFADPQNRYGALKSGPLVLSGRLHDTYLSIDEDGYVGLDHVMASLAACPQCRIATHVDDMSNWPAWKTTTIPNMKRDVASESNSMNPRLFVLPLLMRSSPKHGTTTIEDILADPPLLGMNINEIHIQGILVQKLSAGVFVRRGDIHDPKGSVLLEQWNRALDEMINIF